jgi:hypothetical protein
MEQHLSKAEVELEIRLEGLSNALSKFKVYRDFLGDPEFIRMLHDSDGEAYGSIMKAFCEKDFKRASQLIQGASKIQKSYSDFKALYFDSVFKKVNDDPYNLKLEELIGHSLADISMRSKNAVKTLLDDNSDLGSVMKGRLIGNLEEDISHLRNSGYSKDCNIEDKKNCKNISETLVFDLGVLYQFLNAAQIKISRGICSGTVYVNIKIIYDHEKVLDLNLSFDILITYKQIRAEVESQLDFAFVFTENNVDQISPSIVLDEDEPVTLIKSRYCYKASLILARFMPKMDSQDFGQYFKQLQKSDLYLAMFTLSDALHQAHYVTMKQFNGIPILNAYSRLVNSMQEDINSELFADMVVENDFMSVLQSKEHFCIDLRDILKLNKADQILFQFDMESRKDDTDHLLRMYSLSSNQISNEEPELILLRLESMAGITEYDESDYPATLSIHQDLKYQKIMTRATKDGIPVIDDMADNGSASIDDNKQTTYDIVYERQIQSNDD